MNISLKAIALATAVCLAAPSSAFSYPNVSASPAGISLAGDETIHIPGELGILDEFKLGASRKTFILIQDAHQSFEAQKHISDLIHWLVAEYGIKTVFEEGYEGPVPTDELMQGISDSVVKQRVAYYLMDQLQIGGAEYAHINKKDDFKLIGADKMHEHFDSVAWYGKAARVQNDIDRDLSAASRELERLIPHFVSKPMRRLLKAKYAYEIRKIDFTAYLREIAGIAIESMGDLSFSIDYPGLTNAVRALDSKQAAAIEQVRKLAARDLWKELEQLELDLKRRLLKTQIEKSIILFYEKIEALKRLNKIEMTASEYERVKVTLTGLHTQELADFIARHGKNTVVLSREWEDKIRYALSFYETALERDRAVRDAAETFIKNSNEQTAVLVYGGFHTGRIRETLQSLDVTYAVISPRITRADKNHEERYRRLMASAPQNLKLENTGRLSRPLSVLERMNASPAERGAIVTQMQALREIMNGLPETLPLSQVIREADLKLKRGYVSKGRRPLLRTAKSEVRMSKERKVPSVKKSRKLERFARIYREWFGILKVSFEDLAGAGSLEEKLETLDVMRKNTSEHIRIDLVVAALSISIILFNVFASQRWDFLYWALNLFLGVQVPIMAGAVATHYYHLLKIDRLIDRIESRQARFEGKGGVIPHSDARSEVRRQVYEPASLSVSKTHAEMGRMAAARVLDVVREHHGAGGAVIILPTGSTPTPMYKELVKRFRDDLTVDFSNAKFFNLDEYIGLEPGHPLSYDLYMRKMFYEQLDAIDPSRAPKPENRNVPSAAFLKKYAGYDPSKGPQEIARLYEKKLAQALKDSGRGLADLVVLGVGGAYPVYDQDGQWIGLHGGHIGFNEPGSKLTDRTKVIGLTAKTKKDTGFRFSNIRHRKDFNRQYRTTVPDQAVTLGIANILNSAEVLLLANGEEKSAVIEKAYAEKPNPDFPATFLKYHRNVRWFLDEDAAGKLPHVQRPWNTQKNYSWTQQGVRQAVLETLKENHELGLTQITTAALRKTGVPISVIRRFGGVQKIREDAGAFLADHLADRNDSLLPKNKKVVYFSPHPDDDAITSSVTLRELVERGNDVTVVYLVGGENAVRDDFPPAQAAYEKLYARFKSKNGTGRLTPKENKELRRQARIHVRKDEARRAMLMAGVKKTLFLNLPYYYTRGFVDQPGIQNADVQKMLRTLNRLQPDHIFYSAEQDPHGAHGLGADVIRMALRHSQSQVTPHVKIWGYRGAYEEWKLHEIESGVPADRLVIMPFDQKQMDWKKEVILAHASQLKPLFPSFDPREFWERARDRNGDTGHLLEQLGYLPSGQGAYYAEVFRTFTAEEFSGAPLNSKTVRRQAKSSARSEVRNGSRNLDRQSVVASTPEEYAAFMAETNGDPMPLQFNRWGEMSQTYKDLDMELLLEGLVTNKHSPRVSSWDARGPQAVEPLSKFFDASVMLNFYGKEWRPATAEIERRIKSPLRAVSDIRKSQGWIQALLPLARTQTAPVQEALLRFYEAVTLYTYNWSRFYKAQESFAEKGITPDGSSFAGLWSDDQHEFNPDAFEREALFYESHFKHKAIFYMGQALEALSEVQTMIETSMAQGDQENVPLLHAIRRIQASEAAQLVSEYFMKHPASIDDKPAARSLRKSDRDKRRNESFHAPSPYRDWFRDAVRQRRQDDRFRGWSERSVPQLSPFWALISGLDKTGAKLNFLPGELEDEQVQERAKAFLELEARLWPRDFDAKQQKVRDIFHPLKRPIEKFEFAFGAARMMSEQGYSLPEMSFEPGLMDLSQAWNPIAGSKDSMDLFDVRLDAAHSFYAVTGSNEIGKSTHVKMLGVIVLLAQMGLPIPAVKARLGVFRGVRTLVPSMQGVDVGESQHTGFIKQIRDLNREARPRDLILIDEGHMGSDYKDLVALSTVLLEDLSSTHATAGYATHLKDVPRELARKHPNVIARRLMMRSTGGYYYRRSLEPGVARLSGAVDTLRRTGFSERVLDSFRSYFRALILDEPVVSSDKARPTLAAPTTPFRRPYGTAAYATDQDEHVLIQAIRSVYPEKKFRRGGYVHTIQTLPAEAIAALIHRGLHVSLDQIQAWQTALYPRQLSFFEAAELPVKDASAPAAANWAERFNQVRDQLLAQNQLAQQALSEIQSSGFFDTGAAAAELIKIKQALQAIQFEAKDFLDSGAVDGDALAAVELERMGSRAFSRFSELQPRLEDGSWALLDVALGLSRTIKETGLREVQRIHEGQAFEIRNAHSPMMEQSIEVNLVGDANHPQFVILGANKSGKTSLIQTVRALVLLANKGLYVPADMKIPQYDKLLTFFGASDRIGEKKSYFRVVSERLLSILENASPKSLVIMDEIHGSDYWELSALQAAILKYLHDVGATVILNTHMREGLALAKDIPSLKFLKMDVARDQDGTLRFSYKVLEDPALTSQSFGIESVKKYLTSDQYQRALEIRMQLAEEIAQRKKRAAQYRELIDAVSALPDDSVLRQILEKSKSMDIDASVEAYQRLFKDENILQFKAADWIDQSKQWESLWVVPVQRILSVLKQPGDYDSFAADLEKILVLAKIREWVLLGREDEVQGRLNARSEVRIQQLAAGTPADGERAWNFKSPQFVKQMAYALSLSRMLYTELAKRTAPERIMETLKWELAERAMPEPENYGPFANFETFIRLYAFLMFGKKMTPEEFRNRIGHLDDGLWDSHQAYDFLLTQYPLASYLAKAVEKKSEQAVTLQQLWNETTAPEKLIFTTASFGRDPKALSDFFMRVMTVTETWGESAKEVSSEERATEVEIIGGRNPNLALPPSDEREVEEGFAHDIVSAKDYVTHLLRNVSREAREKLNVPGSRILIYGPGRHTNEIRDLLKVFPNAMIYAADASWRNLEVIKKELDADQTVDQSRVKLVHADFKAMPFSEGFFDAMYAKSTFDISLDGWFGRYYQENEFPFWMNEVKRILKPQGIFFAPHSTPRLFSKNGFYLAAFSDMDRLDEESGMASFVATRESLILDTVNDSFHEEKLRRSEMRNIQEGQLERVDEGESERILTNTEIHGGAYDGRALDQEEIRDLGMQPRHKMFHNGRWFYFPEQVYAFESGRLGVLVYVELKPGDKKYTQEGRYVARAFYRSHSHGGLWRYLPFVFASGPHLGWHGKGHDEDSIGVDYPILKALNQIRFEGGIRYITDTVRLNRLFAGTTWRPGGEKDAGGMDHGYAETYVDVVQRQGHVANTDSHTVGNLPGRTPPEKVHFTNPLEAPDFDKVIDQFEIETGVYSDGVPDRVRIESAAGRPAKMMALKTVLEEGRQELTLPNGTKLVFEGEPEGEKTLEEIIFKNGEAFLVNLNDLRPELRLKAGNSGVVDGQQREGEWYVQLPEHGEFIFDARLQLVRVITPEKIVMLLDYGIVTARVFDSKDEKLQSVFITDKFGRSMMLSLQQKDSPMTEIGIKQSWERAGSLAAALYEYAEQTGNFGDWQDRRENYVGMWLYYHSRIDFIREFTERFVGKTPLEKADKKRAEIESEQKAHLDRRQQRGAPAEYPGFAPVQAQVVTPAVDLGRKWQRPQLEWQPYPAAPAPAPIQSRENVTSSASISLGDPQAAKKVELTDRGILILRKAEGSTVQIPFSAIQKQKFEPILGNSEKSLIRFEEPSVAARHARLSFGVEPGPAKDEETILVYLEELEGASATWIEDELLEPGRRYVLVKRTVKKRFVRSEVRGNDDALNSIAPAVAEESVKPAILQAVRRPETGIAARIASVLPELFNTEATAGENITATQVLARLNADKRYAIRLEWKNRNLALSLVVDDGFDIGINGAPAVWVDIDKPLWTESVSNKHPWRPLVDALIAGLRPDQQRLINEQGYGPRLAALYASARSEVRSRPSGEPRRPLLPPARAEVRSEVRAMDLETAYELQDSILGIDDDENVEPSGTNRPIKLKIEKLIKLFQQDVEVTRMVQTEGLGADRFWEGLLQWSLIAENRDLIAERFVAAREDDTGLLDVWLKLLRRYKFNEKEVQVSLERARVESFKEKESSDGKFLKKFEPKSVPKREAFLYGAWKLNPSEVDSLAGFDLKTLMARYNAWQDLFDQEAHGAVVLKTHGFAELLKLPLTPKRYKRLRAAIAGGRAEAQIALEMKAAGLETQSLFTAARDLLYGYQLWRNAALELADEKPNKLFPRTRPENYWKITQAFRNWLTQNAPMPKELMMQMIHAYTYPTDKGFRKTGAISLFEMKGSEFNQRFNLLISPRFWGNKAGQKRAIWIQAAGVRKDGRKIMTLHLRPNGRPVGVAYWNAQVQDFEDLSGPVFNVINAKPLHRQALAWAQDPYETNSLITNLKVRGTNKNAFAVRLFPGVVQSSISNVRFRAGETIRVSAQAFGDERRFTAYLSEITTKPKRKVEVQYRYYHDDTEEDRLLTPGAELGRRLDISWTQGAPNPIAVRVDREGQLRAGIFPSIRIPSNKNRQVYVVFERVAKEGKVIQQVSVYGQQPKSKRNSEVNYLLWRGHLAAQGRRLVSDSKDFQPRRILGKERYQLQAWLSWGLGYTSPPKAGPSFSQEEIAYLAAGMLREKAMTLKELKIGFEKQNVTGAKLEAVLQKMKQGKGFGGYRIADAGSGRYGLLFSLVMGKGNVLHPFRSHYRISYPSDLEGALVDAMFDGKKILQLRLKDNDEMLYMKHQWDFDGNLIWSGASHPPAQFTDFTFSSYEVPKTQKTSVSTSEQRFRIPGKKGEVIAGVLINGELRRVDWFAPGTQLHNVYKVTAGKKGAYSIVFDEDLQVRPVRYLETKKGSLSLDLMQRAVFGPLRSEVRVLSGALFEDEEKSYQKWESDFETDRKFKGAVLQAAVARQKVRVRALAQEYGQSRRKVRRFLENNGFQKSSVQDGSYEFKIPAEVQRQLDEENPVLPKTGSEELQDRVLAAVSELVVREKQFLPEGTLDEDRYMKTHNFQFWKTVAPEIADLFQPLLQGKGAHSQQVRFVVNELWNAIQVLEAVENAPLNGYQKPIGHFTEQSRFAQKLSAAALAASQDRLFTEKDLSRVTQLRLDLERLHFQSAKTLIEFDRSLSARSEVRGQLPDEGLLRVLGFNSREAYIKQLPKYSPEEWVGVLGKRLERNPEWIPVARDYFDSYFSAKTMAEITGKISMRSIRTLLRSEPHEALAMLLGHAVVLASRRGFMRITAGLGIQAAVKTTPIGFASQVAGSLFLSRSVLNSNRIVVRKVDGLRWLKDVRDYSVPDLFQQLSLEQEAVEKDFSADRHFSWAKTKRRSWGRGALDFESYEKSRGVYTLPVRWIYQHWDQVIGYAPGMDAELSPSTDYLRELVAAAEREAHAEILSNAPAWAERWAAEEVHASKYAKSNLEFWLPIVQRNFVDARIQEKLLPVLRGLAQPLVTQAIAYYRNILSLSPADLERLRQEASNFISVDHFDPANPAVVKRKAVDHMRAESERHSKKISEIEERLRALQSGAGFDGISGDASEMAFLEQDLEEEKAAQLKVHRFFEHLHDTEQPRVMKAARDTTSLVSVVPPLLARSEVRKVMGPTTHRQTLLAEMNHPTVTAKAALLDFKDLVTFSPSEIREAAVVIKQRPGVRFVIYNADASSEKLLHFKSMLGFRNVGWTQSGGEDAFQALGPQFFKEGGVIGFSRGGQDPTGGFSKASRKKMSRFKLSEKKSGTMAVALSFNPEDPRYRWGLLREGDFYVVADSLASLAVSFLNQFVVAVSA